MSSVLAGGALFERFVLQVFFWSTASGTQRADRRTAAVGRGYSLRPVELQSAAAAPCSGVYGRCAAVAKAERFRRGFFLPDRFDRVDLSVRTLRA
jgi:hypothetical protein